MNGFVISVGVYVATLTEDAIAAAKKIDMVTADKNGTAGKMPNAAEFILKMKEKGLLGKKKKTVKC
jgi:hypothetical protein